MMLSKEILAFLCIALLAMAVAKPPMGWSSGFRFKQYTDCTSQDDSCLNEALVKATADELVSGGYLSKGYDHIILEDWMDKDRDSNFQLVPDKKRFPQGFKSLIDYVHGKGLKFGLYLNFGQYTPNGSPGSMFFMDIDAKTMRDWKVDYVKLDAYQSDPNQQEVGIMTFSNYLRQNNNSIHIMCQYPVYQAWQTKGGSYDFKNLAKSCDTWRITGDVQDSFSSIKAVDNFLVKYIPDLLEKQKDLYDHPFDSDFLLIGNTGLSKRQSEMQMMLWSIWNAPLIISADLLKMTDFDKKLLLNEFLIEVNQNTNGNMVETVNGPNKNIQIWRRKISDSEQVVLFRNYNTLGSQINLTKSVKELINVNSGKFSLMDLLTGKIERQIDASTQINFVITLSSGKIFKISKE